MSIVEKELHACLIQSLEKRESSSIVFDKMDMVAGFPKTLDKEMFCEWYDDVNPSEEQIVNYFFKARK